MATTFSSTTNMENVVQIELSLSDDEVFYPSTVSLPKSKTIPGRLSPRRLWTNKSKSQTKLVTSCSWNPQLNRHWVNNGCRQIALPDTDLVNLTESERIAIRQLALVKLRRLNLGCNIILPKESLDGGHKSKKRAILMKKRAATTGFFEKKSKGDQGKHEPGQVFGVPLATCCRQEFERCHGYLQVSRAQSTSAEELFESKIDRSASQASLSYENDSKDNDVSHNSRREEAMSSESLNVEVSQHGNLSEFLIGSTSSFNSDWDLLSIKAAQVPRIASACFRHIENFGLRTVGIFRVGSSKKKVRELRQDFDTGRPVQLTADHCPHVVATLLKEYFRDLPEPLLTRELYPAFLATQKDYNGKLQVEALRYLIQLLPTPHSDTLAALLRFLAKVAANSSDEITPTGEKLAGNKMDTSNLATLFGPNILHTVKGGSAMVEVLTTARADERTDVINVVRTMIDNVDTLFRVTSECLHETYLYLLDRKPELVEKLLNLRSGMSELDVDPDLPSTYVVRTVNNSVPFTPNERKNSQGSQDDSCEGDSARRSRSGTPSRITDKYLAGSKLFRRREKSATPPIDRNKSGNRGTENEKRATSISRWFPSRGKNWDSANNEDTGMRNLQKSKWTFDLSPNSRRRPRSIQNEQVSVMIRCDGERLSVPDNGRLSSRRLSSSDVPDNPVISASLTLRVPSMPTALQMDDRDIPFIDTVPSTNEIVDCTSSRNHVGYDERRRPSSITQTIIVNTNSHQIQVHDSQDSIHSSERGSSISGESCHSLRQTSGGSTPLSTNSPSWQSTHSVPASPRTSPSSQHRRNRQGDVRETFTENNWSKDGRWKRWEIISSEHSEQEMLG